MVDRVRWPRPTAAMRTAAANGTPYPPFTSENRRKGYWVDKYRAAKIANVKLVTLRISRSKRRRQFDDGVIEDDAGRFAIKPTDESGRSEWWYYAESVQPTNCGSAYQFAKQWRRRDR